MNLPLKSPSAKKCDDYKFFTNSELKPTFDTHLKKESTDKINCFDIAIFGLFFAFCSNIFVCDIISDVSILVA